LKFIETHDTYLNACCSFVIVIYIITVCVLYEREVKTSHNGIKYRYPCVGFSIPQKQQNPKFDTLLHVLLIATSYYSKFPLLINAF